MPTSIKNALNNNLPDAVFVSENDGHRVFYLRAQNLMVYRRTIDRFDEIEFFSVTALAPEAVAGFFLPLSAGDDTLSVGVEKNTT